MSRCYKNTTNGYEYYGGKKEYVFYYQLRFAKEHNLTPHTISECIKGKHKQHKGWKFREILDDNEYNKYV